MNNLNTLYLYKDNVGSILISISLLNFNKFNTPSQNVKDIVSFAFYSSIAFNPTSFTVFSNISLYFSLSKVLAINLTHLTRKEAVVPLNTNVKVAKAAVLNKISTLPLSLTNSES